MRKRVAAGNWKMNLTPSVGAAFAEKIAPNMNTDETEVIFCVPFTSLQPIVKALEGFNIGVGAQNMHYEKSGAYTGEISTEMILETKAKYVIIGHSERREYFAETDETVNKKLKTAIAAGLTPIVCVGEDLIRREQGITADFVRIQTRIAFLGICAEDAQKVIIAYEPIWAIGDGKTAATSQQAQEVCEIIRQTVKKIYGNETAEAIRILYGGSVKAKNAAELSAMPDIDGFLVGGASLKEEFVDIVNCITVVN